MKKLFAMVLAVIMMMSMAAMAESVNARVVLQDEMPPAVVSEINANGDVVVAKICGADGTVLAEILDDGSLELTDVHFRVDTANAVVSERLTNSYEDVMVDIHHSDVDCKEHEHVLRIDINNILAGMNNGMDAYDLVMYELYDVMLNGAAAELLAQTADAYVQVTFELMEHHWAPLIVMYSTDGLEWQVIQHVDGADNRFTVQLPASGTLALLVDGSEAMGIGVSTYVPGTSVPGTPGESGQTTPNFTPSVSGKPAPEMIVTEGANGERYVGYIRNDAGDVEIPVPDENYIVVTPVAERDYVVDIQTHEHLEWAYDSILEVKDVGDLYHEHDYSLIVDPEDHDTIAMDLDAVLDLLGLELTHDQLVVKDLFEVTAYGDYVEYLYDPAYYVDVTFDADLDPSIPVVVIHSSDSVHWHIHPINQFDVAADGSITLKMYDMGAVAFLVEAEETLSEKAAVQSPN